MIASIKAILSRVLRKIDDDSREWPISSSRWLADYNFIPMIFITSDKRPFIIIITFAFVLRVENIIGFLSNYIFTLFTI